MDSVHTRVRIQPQIQYPRAEVTYKAPGLYPSNCVLNPAQYGIVGAGSAAVSCILARPQYNLKEFSFLFLTPAHLSAREKQSRFEWQLANTKWFRFPMSLSEQFFTLFFPFWSNAVFHVGVERAMGRDKKTERVHRTLDERWKISASKVGYVVPVWHTGIKWGWAVDGFISGALTGLAYSAVRHPYDVLRHAVTAPDAPKNFSGAGDVLRTIVQEKPSNLLELYKGFGVAATANVCRHTMLFGTYHMWKWELGNSYHWMWFFLGAHVSASLGAVAHYPWEQLRFRVVRANQRSRFSKVTAWDVIAKLRREEGLSVLMDGFFKQRPFLLAMGTATMLTMFDYGSREVWAQTTNRGGATAVSMKQQQQQQQQQN